MVRRAIAEDRIIITSNATDYRELLARKTVHPGAIMILALEREKVWRLIEVALTFLEVQPDPAEFMINRVIEVSASEGILPYVLPVSD